MSHFDEVHLTVAAKPPSKENDMPEKPVCAACRSEEITFDATACWDTKKHQFEYDISDGKVFCLYCDGKQNVDWVAI